MHTPRPITVLAQTDMLSLVHHAFQGETLGDSGQAGRGDHSHSIVWQWDGPSDGQCSIRLIRPVVGRGHFFVRADQRQHRELSSDLFVPVGDDQLYPFRMRHFSDKRRR
jgi:hypothetical protein